MKSRHAVSIAVIGLVALILVVQHSRDTTITAAATTTTTATTLDTTTTVIAPPGTALSAIALLPVKGRAPKTGYTRAQFGPRWADVNHNGCDTRNDILNRDITNRQWRDGTHECVVVAGDFLDPYTGEQIPFTKAKATLVQIDHVVALGDAWQKGAQQLSVAERTMFANDPLNLFAASGHANESKGDGDAATWLPPHKSFRCVYVAHQIAVKLKWKLWVTAAERGAFVRVLEACPREPLPSG